MEVMAEQAVAEIDRLPIDILSHIFVLITCFKDLAQASSVSRKWRKGVKQSMARREKLSFTGWKMDDDSTSRLVRHAYSLRELDISKSRWGCQITDNGLYQLSSAKCIGNLSSISLWGMTGISDKGVVQLRLWSCKTVRGKDVMLDWAGKDVQELSWALQYHAASAFHEFQISRASSLQHLNIGGTFITDESLFAIAGSCPHLKTIVLWGCRHVTEDGLLVLVNNCRELESINVWGMRVPPHCFIALLTISPALQIQPKAVLLDLLPVF